MAQVLVNDTTLSSIADVIREKRGEDKYKRKALFEGTVTTADFAVWYMYNSGGKTYSQHIKIDKEVFLSLPVGSVIHITQIGGNDYPYKIMWRRNSNLYNLDIPKDGEDYLVPDIRSVVDNTDDIENIWIQINPSMVYEGDYWYCYTDLFTDELIEDNNYLPSEMPQKIGDLATVPADAFEITGNCQYMFSNNNWEWFVTNYGDKITTRDLLDIGCMFQVSTKIKSIPFEFNFQDVAVGASNAFSSTSITKVPKLNNFHFTNVAYLFRECSKLKEITAEDIAGWNNDKYLITNYPYCNYIFYYCKSIRYITPQLWKLLYTPKPTSYSYTPYSNMFSNCYSLDEVTDFTVMFRNTNGATANMTSNAFGSTFNACYRLKSLTFERDENGNPYPVRWKAQTIDLGSSAVGWLSNTTTTLRDCGFTDDKRINSADKYAALKDDPDNYAELNWSRYDKASALETIQSLPDASAYLATAGGTNTIKFRGAAGALTDNGAINTLTADEIAIAAAKGWTVSFS